MHGMHTEAPWAQAPRDALSFALLNDWQHGFPRSARPYEIVAAHLGAGAATVRDRYAQLAAGGALGRIGGVWAPGAGGAALLCAMQVGPDRLEAVAALVSQHPGVNHNYEREHDFNLWFVITARDAAQVEAAVCELEARSGCPALRLKMQRAYRIDLGFDLKGHGERTGTPAQARGAAVAPGDEALAACVEAGLDFVDQPYDAWAAQCGRTRAEVLATLQRWLDAGTLRRFGVVVRHHEMGFARNAMTVFDVPDELADTCGEALARQRGITLCYRRTRAPGWPFNLYCMVHGRARGETRVMLDAAIAASGLGHFPHQVLFSGRRFVQRAGRYFRPAEMSSTEVLHVAR